MSGTFVNITMEDAYGKRTARRYQARSSAVSDSEATGLANALQSITQLGVREVTITRQVTFTPQAAETASTRAVSAVLRARKSNGDIHSFNLPSPKVDLLDSTSKLKHEMTPFSNFCEQFDDGTGLLGVAGAFFVSDGETLAENGSVPTQPSGFTQLGGEIIPSKSTKRRY